MAYYPDTRQEKIISILGLSKYVDLFHSMSYDKVPGKHSTLALAKQTVSNWEAESLPKTRLCLGIPFYARHIETGDAKTYEEIHRNYHPLSPSRIEGKKEKERGGERGERDYPLRSHYTLTL